MPTRRARHCGPAGARCRAGGACGSGSGVRRAVRASGRARMVGGGLKLGADEGGEPGREEDRDGIEPQARFGPVLLDVGGGDPGQARDELAVEQQERSGGPDVGRDFRVAQATAEQLPPAVFADEPVQLGRRSFSSDMSMVRSARIASSGIGSGTMICSPVQGSAIRIYPVAGAGCPATGSDFRVRPTSFLSFT
jgi:hypothetical protein